MASFSGKLQQQASAAGQSLDAATRYILLNSLMRWSNYAANYL